MERFAPKDLNRMLAVRKIARDYNRSENWGYQISRNDPAVLKSPLYEDACEDFEYWYNDFKKDNDRKMKSDARIKNRLIA